MSHRAHVVVLGAGFAGLETAFTLRQELGDRVDITVVSPEPDFVFKPNTIYIPFGGDEERLHISLSGPLGRRGIALRQGHVEEVDVDHRRIGLRGGGNFEYSHLVIATGAAMRPEEIPGLAEHALTIWTTKQMRELRFKLQWMLHHARHGQRQRVLFVVPPNNKCAGPLYEVAFMLDTWLRTHNARDDVDIRWTTFENSYIQAFGPRLHELVTAEFAQRHIAGQTGMVVDKVSPHEVVFGNDTAYEYDVLVSFPPYVAAMTYPGLPADDRGFLTTESATRQVSGIPDVYAPGDAGDFPVKQAFLAFLQADAVADDIANDIAPRARRKLRPFDPVSMCVMEMFDKAAFAQVPLEITGDSTRPVQVRSDAYGDYRVGLSRLWRLGKKSLGIYLPTQFGAGRPFHGGHAWQVMELGLKVMSRGLATGAAPADREADTASRPSSG